MDERPDNSRALQNDLDKNNEKKRFKGAREIYTKAFAELKTAKTLAEIFIAFTIFYLIAVTGFLGIDASSDKLGQDMQSKIMAPFYPSKESDVVVILFDENFLDENAWPPKYSAYTNLLDRLENYTPRSVFFDLYFTKRYDGNGNGAALEGAIEALRSKFPIYSPRQPESIIDSSWMNMSTMITTEWDHVSSSFYPSHAGNESSPAFMIYCDTHPNCPCPKDDMFIRWPLSDMTIHDQGYLAKLFRGLSLLFYDADATLQTKPYITRISYDSFINPNNDYSDKINGKHVMIGARLTGVSDWVVTPVDGKTDGVLLHAMALDNLEKFGGYYLVNGDSRPVIAGLNQSNIAEIIAIAIIYVVYRFFHALGELRNKKAKYLFISALSTFSIVVFIVMITTFTCRLDPGNFMALISLNYPLAAWLSIVLADLMAWTWINLSWLKRLLLPGDGKKSPDQDKTS